MEPLTTSPGPRVLSVTRVARSGPGRLPGGVNVALPPVTVHDGGGTRDRRVAAGVYLRFLSRTRLLRQPGGGPDFTRERDLCLT